MTNKIFLNCISLCTLFVSPLILSQTVFVNPSIIVFDTTLSGTTDSLSFWVVNKTTQPVNVSDINLYGGLFSVTDTAFTIGENDSAECRVYFSAIHNLTYNDFIFVETATSFGSIVVPISGTKKYPEPLYAPTQGLSGELLKTALNTVAKQGHVTLGYNTSRDKMYGNIDSNNGLDSVECIYTGRKAKFTTRSAATTNNFNCEHTWPQSKFSEADPMKSDIHHLFPTDNPANGIRSNYPFGIVTGTPSWSVGGSKLGAGNGGGTVFEPRDEHKGDCARTMFYFIVRYPNNYGSFWAESPYQETAFRGWNKKFPPTAKSIARNNGVQLYQGNRNPFIDHPEFIDRINNFGETATISTAPRLVASPYELHFNVAQNVEPKQIMNIGVANIGNASLKITETSFSNPAFTFADSSTDIETNGYRIMQVQFDGSTAGDYSGTLTMKWSDGTTTQSTLVALEGTSVIINSADENVNIPSGFSLAQNYPNPFNPSTTIGFTLQVSGFTILKIYNVLGKEVATLVNEMKEAGHYSITFSAEGGSASGGDASTLPSGIYFYRMQSGNFVETKRMMLLK